MRFVSSVLTSLAVVGLLTVAGNVHAQDASPTGKGVVGGALLGAELVLVIEAAFGVQSPWAYVGGGLAGAAAGGVGGYFVERDSGARYPMLMLAGGMALAIPTTVAVLTATSYRPPADYVQDVPPTDEPIADPPRPQGAVLKTRSVARSHAEPVRRSVPPALLDVDPGRIVLSIPSVELCEVFTREEVATLGVPQATEIRVPVLNVLF